MHNKSYAEYLINACAFQPKSVMSERFDGPNLCRVTLHIPGYLMKHEHG